MPAWYGISYYRAVVLVLVPLCAGTLEGGNNDDDDMRQISPDTLFPPKSTPLDILSVPDIWQAPLAAL